MVTSCTRHSGSRRLGVAVGVAPVPYATRPGSGRHMLLRVQPASANVAVATLADPAGVKVRMIHLFRCSKGEILALDKQAIACVTKELCRCFAAPNVRAQDAHKICVKYLRGRPRIIWGVLFEPPASTLTTACDTGFAGCLVTRRTTTEGIAKWGWGVASSGIGRRLKAWSYSALLKQN